MIYCIIDDVLKTSGDSYQYVRTLCGNVGWFNLNSNDYPLILPEVYPTFKKNEREFGYVRPICDKCEQHPYIQMMDLAATNLGEESDDVNDPFITWLG